MNDEQLTQRIRYLVEHGGLYDDPLADIRRRLMVATTMGGVALVLHVLDFLTR